MKRKKNHLELRGNTDIRKTTYYKDRGSVLTNAENAGALTEGGAPADKGDYYVKVEMTFREKYKSESDYLLYKISDGEIEGNYGWTFRTICYFDRSIS